ncbi:methylmalonyl-CoA mutase family protein [Flavobacterium sp. CS20]|uniref:methylmalonyl-CoA mutase family protein n=1 Tax=Flavobacterium sp. CS20 TaxID=2775246 RepID=UPI001B3A4F8B|nr:methylmalonyl-CoA mutase family protein [Flavobacterium sp. CS20]QTY27375.1 methylmalonyl-CoA mutase [Flavobacterium sp. CS20]
MPKQLFEEFKLVSEKTWKQKIQADLKGKDYNQTMLTSTDEGIDIKPFYHQDSHQKLNIPSPQQWLITEKTDDLENLDQFKSKGAEAFWIKSDQLPENISNLNLPLILEIDQPEQFNFESRKNLIYKFDPIHHLAQTGNWLKSQDKDFSLLQNFVEKSSSLNIDSRLYHNSGANITQQLAYSIAHLNSYFKALDFSEIQTLKLYIFCGIGPNYFFEIAKLKALRVLVNSICKYKNIKYKLKIISEPGQHHMSIYDYNVNLLRTTTECMSAILGGSDLVCNTTYDKIFKNNNEFSQRIARNQLLILKNESYFDKVSNPSDGSYYVDYLTNALSEKALELFKSIEKSNGFIQQLFDGKIQEKIDQQFSKSLEQFKNKKLKLVGVNVFENEDDKMKEQLEKNIFPTKHKRKTLLKPITKRRIAEQLEQQRLSQENI